MRGSPAIMSIIVNGIKKAPPPFEQHRYGNRQTLPRPTLQPRRDNRKSNFPVHVPRSGCSSSPACNGAWLFATEYLSSFCYKGYIRILLFPFCLLLLFYAIEMVLCAHQKFDNSSNGVEFRNVCEGYGQRFSTLELNFQ